MQSEVRLLSEPVNFAVVQLPQRKYPGIVVQGDSFFSILQRLDESIELLNSGSMRKGVEVIEQLRNELQQSMNFYEVVCERHKISLSYETI